MTIDRWISEIGLKSSNEIAKLISAGLMNFCRPQEKHEHLHLVFLFSCENKNYRETRFWSFLRLLEGENFQFYAHHFTLF